MKQCSVVIGKRSPQRRGFTLVEMLVSVGLVLLMMTMFASIFQMAADSVGKQRSVSENDQKARSLFNIIRSDIQHRTFRYPLPFYPDEKSATSATRFGNRGGYIYISTNDPLSGLDDILQFTVDSNITNENQDTTPFVGRAARLKDLKNSAIYSGVNDPRRSDLTISPNQPDADDGSLALDGKSQSTAGEIAYFVRGGNLYRRVILLRDPIGVAGQQLEAQPRSASGYNLLSAIDEINFAMPTPDATSRFQLHDGTLTNDFWRNFDHAAFAAFPPGNPQHASLLGLASLNNDAAAAGAVGQALGNPVFRFGFNGVRPVSGLFSGASREHTDTTGAGFIGRYTQAETSASNFNWPQFLSEVPGSPGVGLWSSNLNSPGNPMDLVNAITLDSRSQVTEFSETSGTGRGGPRRMEDLLLSGVQELKIEIWDDRLNRFVTPGHSEVDLNPPSGFPGEGDYHISRSLNRLAGPFGSHATGVNLNKTFDTWHPEATVDLNANGSRDLSSPSGAPALTTPPPFISYSFYPPVAPTGPSPVTSTGPFGSYWQSTTYTVPPPTAPPVVVFAPWTDNHPPAPDGVFQYGESDFSIAYKLVVGGTAGATAPTFPKRPGLRIVDGTCQWESFDNRRPLQAIRMTVRFMDQKSQSVRQLSLILPMLEQKKT